MPSITTHVKRRYALSALAAGLIAAVGSAPTPAAARTQQDAEAAPSRAALLSNIQYLYYDSPSLTNQVGFADDNCGAGYVLHWGVATDYVKVRTWACPE